MKLSIRKRIFLSLSIFAFSGLLTGCGKNENKNENVKDDKYSEYKTIEDGLKYKILKEGEGEAIEIGQNIKVNYIGRLEDGTEFDNSYDRGVMRFFNVGDKYFIEGWTKGIVGMKLHEKREIVIPPEYGYKDKQQGKIPPNSTLIFEITLEEIIS